MNFNFKVNTELLKTLSIPPIGFISMPVTLIGEVNINMQTRPNSREQAIKGIATAIVDGIKKSKFIDSPAMIGLDNGILVFQNIH